MNYKDEWNKIGYNQEELYFEKLNRELIQQIKSQKLAPIVETTKPMATVLQFKARTGTKIDLNLKKVA